MDFGSIVSSLFCLVMAVVLLALGSAAWLAIRGRAVTPNAVGNMIGGMVKWMIADFLIDMIFSSVFNSNRRRRW